MNHVEQHLTAKLAERTEAGNLRRLQVHGEGIDFYSNDYLGIVTNNILQDGSLAIQQTGSTGSRLISGNNKQVEELEATIAAFHKVEAALIFNSGYDANTGLLTSIANRDTIFLYDELCHASIIDGIRHSLCKQKYKFAHNDLNELQSLLEKHTGTIIVVTESVYSMDGDTAPLTEMATLCEKHGAQLIVDEAHATGVIGSHGEGLVCALGLQDRVFARVHTFGKALGCHGAAVVGSSVLKQYLINFARTFIYTTALPPLTIHTISRAYNYLSNNDFTNQPLHDIIGYFRTSVEQEGIMGLKESNTPIQALVTGGNEHTCQLATRLQQSGLLVNPIFHPTVPLGMERLRICLHSFNTKEQVDLLIKHLHP